MLGRRKRSGQIMSYHTIQRQDHHGTAAGTFILLKGNHADHTSLQLDAGQHPAREGLAALPYFDEFDLSTIDILLISQ